MRRSSRNGSRKCLDARDLSQGAKQEDVHYIHHPSFSLPATGRRLWGPEREEIHVEPYSLLPEVGEAGHAKRTVRTALSRKQERTLFLRYNYAKYRVSQLVARRRSPKRRKELALWRGRARAVREKIIHANLPLVPAMAERKRVEGVELAEKTSEGYMAILRSVEHFDVSRGFKFSTYACRAILAALYRLGSKAQAYRKHVAYQFEPDFEKDDYSKRRQAKQRADVIQSVRVVLARNDAELNEVQEHVVRKRYPVGGKDRPRPLWKIGRELGVSTERVRQIEKQSLRKLAGALDEVLTA